MNRIKMKLNIRKRKKEAKKKKIYDKVFKVAVYLGRGKKDAFDYLVPELDKHVFINDEFEIYDKLYSGKDSSDNHKFKLDYKGKIVFEGTNLDTISYAPGKWEEIFNKLYKEAKKQESEDNKSKWNLYRIR